MSENGLMTNRERDELAKLVRKREKLAKVAMAGRAAELEADFEAQLAARYEAEDAAWKDYVEKAEAAVRQADAQIARIAAERGIPKQFRPSFGCYWRERGENASKERRAELRKVAKAAIAAAQKTAAMAIERRSVEIQTELVAGGLQSDAAKAFLETMPTPEQLMPPVLMADVEKRLRVAHGQTAIGFARDPYDSGDDD
jgi:hypothetical protein